MKTNKAQGDIKSQEQNFAGDAQHVCPNCGFCPCCGRRNGWGMQPYNPWPNYPLPYIGDPVFTISGTPVGGTVTTPATF